MPVSSCVKDTPPRRCVCVFSRYELILGTEGCHAFSRAPPPGGKFKVILAIGGEEIFYEYPRRRHRVIPIDKL